MLLELNEYALYQIYDELLFLNENLKIYSLLVNAQDQFKLEKIFENFNIHLPFVRSVFTRDFKCYNRDNFVSDLRNVNWDDVLNNNSSADTAFDQFNNLFTRYSIFITLPLLFNK